jgi:hypothetical protein
MAPRRDTRRTNSCHPSWLNPDQKGGSVIALPDPELRADLTAPTYDVTDRGIRIEGKDDIRARLGRSPGNGDAVVMCLSESHAAVMKAMRRDGGGQGLQAMSVRGYRGLKAGRRYAAAERRTP